jgi:hypothetical protein
VLGKCSCAELKTVEGVVVNRLGKVFAVAGSVVLSVALLTAGGGVSAAESDSAALEWLFATDAADVTISKTGSGFSVSLPASERVTAFTDRPNRLTAVMTLREFAKDWKAYGFDTDPPNAALLLETGSKTRTCVAEMTNPRIKNGQVTFRLNPIDGSASVAGHTNKHTLKPAAYNHASLFIDGFDSDCTNTGGAGYYEEKTANGANDTGGPKQVCQYYRNGSSCALSGPYTDSQCTKLA